MGAETQDGAGGELGAQSGFDMVSDDRPQKLPPGIFVIPAKRDAYGPVSILEIAGRCARPQVHPLPDNRLPQKTVMLFVGIAQEDGVDDFAADAAIRADGTVLA